MAIQFPTSSSYETPPEENTYPVEEGFDDFIPEKASSRQNSSTFDGLKLNGKVKKVIYTSEGTSTSNGFAVLVLETLKGAEERVSGPLSGYKEGDMLSLRVEKAPHPKYGMQYKALGILSNEEQDPIDQLAMFLEGGFISHIGPARTRAILEKFGTSFTEVVKENPAALTVISGITPARSVEIAQSWLKYTEKWEVMGAMRAFGIPDNILLQWSQKPGVELIFERVKKNPYLLTKERGIGFIKADIIARKNGVAENAAIRIESGFAYALEQAAQEGNTCLPLAQLFEQTKGLLFPNQHNIDANALYKKFETVFVQHGESDEPLFQMKIRENERKEKKVFAYLPQALRDERDIVQNLSEKLLLHTKPERRFVSLLNEWEEKDVGFPLHEQQRAAVLMAVTAPISIITGGPGTGKTTILSLLVDLCDRETIACCAPTGRAAKRMGEVITSEWGTKPQTIHRLLGYNGTGFKAEDESALPFDFVIIDEVSMMDQSLFASLLRSMATTTRLVLIGDADQLPSVGAGNILHDLIESKVIPVTRLTKIYRQSEDSYIPRNAWAVANGQVGRFVFEQGSDFSFHPLSLSQNIGQQIVKQVEALERLGLSQSEIMVLSPKKAGPAGVNILNTLLQEHFNAQGKTVPFPVFEDRLPFRLGDPVMQTKNDYTRGVFNGDIGYISEIRGKQIKIDFDYDLELAQKELSEVAWWTSIDAAPLIPAYASTVHKAQGGQSEGVIMVCDKGSQFMIGRELLYTGITRAKQYCSIVGDKGTVINAIEKSMGKIRSTGLKDELILATQKQKISPPSQ